MVTNKEKTHFSGEQRDTEERVVFEQEVGLPDFTFSLIITRIQSPLKLVLYPFLRGTKAKSLLG